MLCPGAALVAAAQDRAAATDCPAVIVVQKLHAQQSDVHVCRRQRPSFAAVAGAQQHAVFADGPAVFIVTKIDVVERAGDAGSILLRPTLSTVASEKNRAAIADDPAPFVTDEIDVNQLEPARRALTSPRFAAVVRVNQNAVDHAIAFADGTNGPTFFLAREAKAVKLDLGVVEFFR